MTGGVHAAHRANDAAREKGWYWIKLNDQPHPPWQPACWNGLAFWIGGKAYRRGTHWTKMARRVIDVGFCEVHEERIPEPKEMRDGT